jgi:Tripartite tricarboxylate transporter family receptor/T6SS, Phospholipase effector Tle1-like, catalytic domain
VIPFPPAGGYDFIGRPWADKVKPLLGTIVVENIGGGGGSLGAAAVAHAGPDGYTLLVSGTNVHINEALLKGRPLYNPIKDLQPISCVGVGYWAIAIHPSLPVQTLTELIAYARANPGKLSYGHSGIGTINHLAGELFKSLAGTPEIVPVPYRGAGPASSQHPPDPVKPLALLGGDCIHGFGFSRGAFTIRVLVNFVLSMGLVSDFDSTDDLKRKSRALYLAASADSRPGGCGHASSGAAGFGRTSCLPRRRATSIGRFVPASRASPAAWSSALAGAYLDRHLHRRGQQRVELHLNGVRIERPPRPIAAVSRSVHSSR